MSEHSNLQNEIRGLIAGNEIEAAIRRLLVLGEQEPFRHLHNPAARQSAAFRKLTIDQIKGVLSQDEITRTANKITDVLLDLVEQLGTPPPLFPGDASTRNTQTAQGNENILLSDINNSNITIIHNYGPKSGDTSTQPDKRDE